MKSPNNLSKALLGGLFAIVFTGVVSSSAKAQLVNFDFSFSNTTGATPGTVTGELIGLENNATSQPTDVIITSAPEALDITTPANYALIGGDGFTVTNGVIIGGDLQAGTGLSYDLALNSPGGGYNSLQGASLVENQNGLSGVNYTLASSSPNGTEGGRGPLPLIPLSAPEPSTWAMLVGGLGLLAFWRLRSTRARV